jgi:protein arginine N-methyltransferase 1
MSLQFDEHRQYLVDRHRLHAFEAAIARVVRPGDVVVDLACGTGILGLLACRAGAARVYAIDDGGMLDIARQVAAANGVADRITHIRAFSTRAELPERADVVVADQMGRLGFEAGVVEFFADASRRFLKPGGRLLPRGVTTWMAPVDAPDMTACVDFWMTKPAGFDVSVVRHGAANTGYPASFESSQCLADAAPLLVMDFAVPDNMACRGAATFVVSRSGTFSGLGGWFVADMADAVTMTNAPGAPDQIGRRQAFLPLDGPVDVAPGDTVECTILARPADSIVAWRVIVRRGTEVRRTSRQSTLAGMLLGPEILEQTDPSRRPRLTPWADARATILRLCDGEHTLAHIESETAARHPALFPTPAAAAQFVAEVVTRYGRTDAR